ncbi:MAG: CcmD family protein [Ignavibacteria bacterium]|jgi:hypothetical protein
MMQLLTDYPMYVVLTTALIIWAGIALYVQRIDARLHNIESK